jgi:hypothetical protein
VRVETHSFGKHGWLFSYWNSTTESSTQEGQAMDILWKNIDRSWTLVANSMRRHCQRPKDC